MAASDWAFGSKSAARWFTGRTLDLVPKRSVTYVIRRRTVIRILHLVLAAAFAAAMFVSSIGSAQAQEYPSRPIRLIVPSATGGLTDMMGRMLGQRLSDRLGQPVVVENRPGAGAIIGMKAGAQAAPDGYTLTLTYLGAASVNPILYRDPPYDTLREFEPVAQVAAYPMVLLTYPGASFKTVRELVEQAKAKPGAMNYGSPGNASTAHLAMELFKRQTGIDIVHVPFKGEAPPMLELMAGRLTVLFQTLGTALPSIEAGKLHALGLATSERSKRAPDVPTLAELGIQGLDVPGWYGVLAPARTPKAVVDRLNREIVAIVAESEFQQRLSELGVEPVSSSPQAFREWIRSETIRWERVVKDAGIKAE